MYFSVRKRAKGKGRNRRYKRANSSPRKSGVQKHVEGSGAGEVPKAARQGLNNGWGLLISAGLADVSLSICLSVPMSTSNNTAAGYCSHCCDINEEK